MTYCVRLRSVVPWMVVFFFTVSSLSAQQDIKIPNTVFRSPLGFPLYLSGTFGEPRSGHLHSGIDIKTQGAQGKKVYAVDNGYVSRIKVSTSGYGKALYVTHPNGLVSVYGHLSKFNWHIQQYVKKIQYERESFTVEIFPKKGELPVKKGEVIAFSGDTGGSDAPHLHFELREAKSEHPVNPLLFKGINVADHLPPKIYRLAIYPSGVNSCVNDRQDTLVYWVSGSGKHCYIKKNPLIKVSGPISFGLQTYDVLDKVHNHDGVYKIELYEDGKLVYGLRMKEISFATTRYVNSLIDYHYYVKKGRRLYRTEIDPNNRIMNYYSVKNHGVFDLKDTLVHQFKYVVSDIYGNRSVLPFNVIKTNAVCRKNKKRSLWLAHAVHIPLDKPVKIDSGALKLRFAANSFYRPVAFPLKKYSRTNYSYSEVFGLQNRFITAQKFFTLSIKPDPVVDKLMPRLYLAYSPDRKKSDYQYAGNSWSKKGSLVARVRNMGFYTVMADTVPPVIKPINFSAKTYLKGKKALKVWINDEQTGIGKYVPKMNGHWILMEYDPKTKLLVYHPDQYLKKGKNEFELTVYDLLGNKKTYKAEIILQ
ncbi:MAG: M23 family metallopeptidase [Bacteroidales bacterium]|nr:M23 family metallopeptidase [Bacteroidales bacterium]